MAAIKCYKWLKDHTLSPEDITHYGKIVAVGETIRLMVQIDETIEQDSGFPVALFRNRYTEVPLKKSELNKRQAKAVLYVVDNGSINNSKYQELFGVARITATRDLKQLIEKGFLMSSGSAGAGSSYTLPIAS